MRGRKLNSLAVVAALAAMPAGLVPSCGWMIQKGSGTYTGVVNTSTSHRAQVQAIPVGDDQSSVKNFAPICIDQDGYTHQGPTVNADNPPPQAQLPNGSGSYLFYADCLWKTARSYSYTPSYTPVSIVIR